MNNKNEFNLCDELNECCVESVRSYDKLTVVHMDNCMHGTKDCPCFECKGTRNLIDVLVENDMEMLYESKSLEDRVKDDDEYLDNFVNLQE